MSKERVILANGCIYSSDPQRTGVNNNVAGVGGPGSGKTESLVKPELNETLNVSEPMNRIVVVTKRSIPNLYIPLFKQAGFNVYDLNYSNMEAGNCADDPLAYVDSEEDVLELAHSIVMANERKEHSNADPFWDDAAEALIVAEIGLAFIKKGEKATFADALYYHDRLKIEESGCGISTSLDSTFKDIEKADPECFAIRFWKTFREAAPKTAKSIFVSLNPTLKAYTENIRHCMKTKPVVDFKRFCQEKSILFITTSPVKKSLHSLANIFVSTAISKLFEIADDEPTGSLKRPVHITFDDFATGAKISEMPEKLAICREKKLSFTLLLQSEAQLEKMYGHCGSVEILDCCDSYVFMGGNNYETARNVSLRLNVPVNEVLEMPIGRAIVFRRGEKPVVTERYEIMKDKFYKNILANLEREGNL